MINDKEESISYLLELALFLEAIGVGRGVRLGNYASLKRRMELFLDGRYQNKMYTSFPHQDAINGINGERLLEHTWMYTYLEARPIQACSRYS